MKQHQIHRLITITRNDIPAGYQIAQSGHAVAQYFLDYPDLAKQWNNNYFISLSIDTEQKLQKLLFDLIECGISVSAFYEPDIENQLTSICFGETDQTKKYTHKLKLSLKNLKS